MRSLRAAGCLLPALLAAGLCGCSSGAPVVSLAPPAHPPAASEYNAIRERWTRNERILKALDTPLNVYATLFSPEFTAVYLTKVSEMFRLLPGERAALERKLRDEAGGGFYFFISATSHEWNWIDFERKDSVWHITLLNSRGEEVRPARIEHKRDVTATTTELFPYVGEFHHAYTMQFPLALPDGRPLVRDGERRLTLRFAGPLGQAELVWKFR